MSAPIRPAPSQERAEPQSPRRWLPLSGAPLLLGVIGAAFAPAGVPVWAPLAVGLVLSGGLLALFLRPGGEEEVAAVSAAASAPVAAVASAVAPTVAPTVAAPRVAHLSLVPDLPTPAAAPQPAAPAPAGPWIDAATLMERLGGDRELLGELIELFEVDTPHRIDALREAALVGDSEGVSRAAHGIKSGLSNFCAAPAQARAFELERFGREGALPGDIVERIDALQGVLDVVVSELKAVCAEGAA
jgi:HPt (histidine-containing phosphotransfer) domain-containing protein